MGGLLLLAIVGLAVWAYVKHQERERERAKASRITAFAEMVNRQYGYSKTQFTNKEAAAILEKHGDVLSAVQGLREDLFEDASADDTQNVLLGVRKPNLVEGIQFERQVEELSELITTTAEMRDYQKLQKTAGVALEPWYALAEVGGLPAYIPGEIRKRHTYIVGKTGSGKSTLLTFMVWQDIEKGRGVALLAPEAETIVEEVMPFIPEYRIPDVVYINPADAKSVNYINPFYLREGENFDLKAANIYTLLERLMEGDMSPRISQILRQACHALLEIPNSCLLDVPKLLDRRDGTFRASVIERLTDHRTRAFWEQDYEEMPANAHVAIMTRLSAFIRPTYVRNIVGRRGPGVDFRSIMDEGKILLCNLSDGLMGKMASRLLGGLIMAELSLATLGRANAPQSSRTTFYVYLDEFQSFVSSGGVSYDELLSRGRKYGTPLILAHQQTGQLPTDLVREILGNVATAIVFQVGREDANKMTREFVRDDLMDGERPNPEDMLVLPVGHAIAKIDRVAFPLHVYFTLCDFDERKREGVEEEIILASHGDGDEAVYAEPFSDGQGSPAEGERGTEGSTAADVSAGDGQSTPSSPFPDDLDPQTLF